jgi:hypothetical protein
MMTDPKTARVLEVLADRFQAAVEMVRLTRASIEPSAPQEDVRQAHARLGEVYRRVEDLEGLLCEASAAAPAAWKAGEVHPRRLRGPLARREDVPPGGPRRPHLARGMLLFSPKKGIPMPQQVPPNQQSEKDRLVTRPGGQLPTPLDPAGPEAHGFPKDPKPDPATDRPDDISRSV